MIGTFIKSDPNSFASITLTVGFFKWNPLAVDPSMQFEGLGFNYRRLIFDQVFLESIWRSIKFAFVTLFFELTLGFLLALSLLSSFPLSSATA